jgi:hypothetical protein
MKNQFDHSKHDMLGTIFIISIFVASFIAITAKPGTRTQDLQAAPASPRAATMPGSSDPTCDEWRT